MSKIKEVSVFSIGDSSQISTWSNIPFFFTETLLAKGIVVNRIDIQSSSSKEKKFRETKVRFIRRLFPKTSYEYFRSKTHFDDVRHRVKKALKQYPNADAHIFLTFSFSSAGLTKKPVILFGDWTYEHYIRHFRNQKPDFLEKSCLNRENKQIENANFVFPLFPAVAEYMNSRYKNKQIHYLGNVINSLLDAPEKEVLALKEKSNTILFVGNQQYHEGAKTLIEAFKQLKENQALLTLHIIGMESTDFENLPKDVYCHGYLDKGVENERELYYRLFKEAKVLINTTPKWAGFSSTIEAMYFYTPVVVSPYDEFQKTFGKQINFGAYCQENTPSKIAEKISSILSHENYNALCTNAHDAVKDFTWKAYVDSMLEKIEGERK